MLGLFPSDHVVDDEKKFRGDLKRAAEIAATGENIVVIGIRPTRAETGYGYVEAGEKAKNGGTPGSAIPRETERGSGLTISWKPETISGMAGSSSGARKRWSTPCTSICPRQHSYCKKSLPATVRASSKRLFARLYPQCENISVDYAIAEPRSAKGEDKSGIYCIPASFGWNDLGSWTALYEHRQGQQDAAGNVVSAKQKFLLNAGGNFVVSEKFVAVVGVEDLIVVETADALLITTKQNSQDVGKIVKYLDEKKMKKLV